MSYYGKLKRQAKINLQAITTCAYCQKEGTTEAGPDGGYWHMDHILPWSVYQLESLENYVKSCRTCNISKGYKTRYPSPDALTGALIEFKKTRLLEKTPMSVATANQVGELEAAKQFIELLEKTNEMKSRNIELLEREVAVRNSSVETLLVCVKAYEVALARAESALNERRSAFTKLLDSLNRVIAPQ
jgi:HNH endonuclease